MSHKRIKAEWSKCRVCGQDIFRDLWPTGPGPWWHDWASLDIKHQAEPSPAPRLIDCLKSWLKVGS